MAPFVEANIGGHKLITLLDPGSNTSIITHKAAKKVGAKSRFVREWVKLAGKPEETQETCIYTFKWKFGGKVRTIRALVMSDITDAYGPESIEPAYDLFPQYKAPQLNRPKGDKVHLLIGLDYNEYLASGGQGDDHIDSLRVMDTPLSASGKVLTGHHPSIRGRGSIFSSSAVAFRKAVFIDSKEFSPQSTRSINLVTCHAHSS